MHWIGRLEKEYQLNNEFIELHFPFAACSLAKLNGMRQAMRVNGHSQNSLEQPRLARVLWWGSTHLPEETMKKILLSTAIAGLLISAPAFAQNTTAPSSNAPAVTTTSPSTQTAPSGERRDQVGTSERTERRGERSERRADREERRGERSERRDRGERHEGFRARMSERWHSWRHRHHHHRHHHHDRDR